MSNSSYPVLKDADYHIQLILLFLTEQLAIDDQTLSNLKTIVDGTGINYNTLNIKLVKLQALGLIHLTHKGKEKIVLITDEGKKAIHEWQSSDVGQRMINDLKEKLAERKKGKI